MQTKIIAGVARLVLAAVLFSGLAGMVRAEDDTALSTDDERAYQAALASWQHFAEINEEVGLPPLGDRPQREDFVGYTKAQQEAAVAQVAARQEAEARWQQRLKELSPYIREVVPIGERQPKDARSQIVREEQEGLRRFADQAWARRDAVRANLEAIARKHGVPVVRQRDDGRFEQISGELGGYPVWISSHNQIAAAGVSADELWPTNSAPWPSSSTGKDLTGTNVILAAWEVGGGVNTNHAEFGGRVLQMDAVTNLADHATGVVGTMAAHGDTISLPGIPTGSVARGVAFDAYVDAYDTWDFASEIADASIDATNSVGLRLSNHSWGIPSVWAVEFIDTFWYGGTEYNHYQWDTVWQQNPALYEDPFCGLYLWDSDGYGSAELDGFISTNASRHLLLYSAGNDRFYGPGQPVYYFYSSGGEWHLVNNPPANDKDWSIGDGDTYGFDTVKPPGTTKNVLTVGSVSDVYHDEGGNLRWGYATNSTVTVSAFSGCGPTDDGRIKPDIMAVGEADSAVRLYGLVTPIANGGYTNGYDGTSFAAPSVTAGLGLCLQRRNQLFPGLDPSLDAWRSSTLKVLAIHTADDVINPGPDYQTGWGLFNAVSAVEQVELDAQDGRGTHLKELELAVGITNAWMVDVDASEFKVSIAWNDPPGVPTGYADDSTPMLVNDIDLWVETEDGSQVFRPWILDPDLQNEQETNRNAFATTGIDDRNNVEQVLIQNPTSGLYRICIAHTGGTAGGHTPTAQWVSVATSGDTPLSPKIAEYEQSPSTNQFLLTIECDPGAHLILETSTNLLNSSGWVQEGTFTTESWTNAVLANPTGELRFWRLRRETGN